MLNTPTYINLFFDDRADCINRLVKFNYPSSNVYSIQIPMFCWPVWFKVFAFDSTPELLQWDTNLELRYHLWV